MPAQGAALGNGVVVENLVSPFQGWADSHSDRIPRADPASGVPPAWAFLFRPLRGSRKRNTASPARLFPPQTPGPRIAYCPYNRIR